MQKTDVLSSMYFVHAFLMLQADVHLGMLGTGKSAWYRIIILDQSK